ncbi:hypothetical protein MA16_Dca006178 [Dendrobium catenatum]|uniref:Uncharacterized protein n=1 Tax=Dendrobium catenatum TaxID=906689 RepID=A0A2I0X4Q2_9ASPA|nr:hypothetical protein MA16_Dca006178 [Dendrobium catenatum]
MEGANQDCEQYIVEDEQWRDPSGPASREIQHAGRINRWQTIAGPREGQKGNQRAWERKNLAGRRGRAHFDFFVVRITLPLLRWHSLPLGSAAQHSKPYLDDVPFLSDRKAQLPTLMTFPSSA